MPTGVYKRTKKHFEQTQKNFAKGRLPKARKKAIASIKATWTDDKRRATSERTRRLMTKPSIRKRHLAALKRSREKHGVEFKGGNGQEPVNIIRELSKVLTPLGFVRELVIKTREHQTTHKPPPCYKVDFGNVESKIAIEVDGPKHRSFKQLALDKKKQEVLENLGWEVQRIKHD